MTTRTVPSISSFFRRSWSVLPLLVVTWWAGGCTPVTSIPITKQARESIQSVSIDKNVATPGDMVYSGRVPLHMIFIGPTLSDRLKGDPRNALVAAMRWGQIDVGQIVREQFVAELDRAGIFPSIVPEVGDAQVKLGVDVFGFGATGAPTTEVRPMLGVTASLVRKDGSVVWQRREYITSLNGETPKHLPEEYLQTPELIRQGFESVAKLVAAALVNHMRNG